MSYSFGGQPQAQAYYATEYNVVGENAWPNTQQFAAFHNSAHNSGLILLAQEGHRFGLKQLLECLPICDKLSLRLTCQALRSATNAHVKKVVLGEVPVYRLHAHPLLSTQQRSLWPRTQQALAKLFPAMEQLAFALNTPQECKAACMHLLSQMPASLAGLGALELSEGKQFLTQSYHAELQGGGQGDHTYNPYFSQQAPHQATYQRGNLSTATVSTLDFTEVLLAGACSCSGLENVTVEKTVLLDTEAGAIARIGSRLKQLCLATNSSAKPLRRPLVELMLSQLTALTDLRLSYIRDTTADLARSLPALQALTRFELSYACFGNNGAGQRIAEALAKHQTRLQALKLHECGVDDAMLDTVMYCKSLTSLHIQDEDAPEDSHPTNQGLSRITNLTNLSRLQLFGEELRLDPELLAALAKLPALTHLAVAGLDGLHMLGGPSSARRTTQPHSGGAGAQQRGDGAAQGGAGDGGSDDDFDMDLSSAGDVNDGGDGDDDDASSSSMSMEDVTSRHRGLDGFTATGPSSRQPSATPGPSAHPGVPRPNFNVAQPLQQLSRLSSLVLYGPASLRVFPPPLSLLLPQPALKHLKLSACASAANLRALTHQQGLEKLTLSHSNVVDLYPATSASATDVVEDSGLGGDFTAAAAAAVQQQHQYQHVSDALTACSPVLQPPVSTSAPSGSNNNLGASAMGNLVAAVSGASVPMSVLGYGPEVRQGLASLRVLRLKDLPGFDDSHLADLISALAGLPALTELKLRSLPAVSSQGLAGLPQLQQLERLKLYALGYGVCNGGILNAVARMPALRELKVKGCGGVMMGLAAQVAEARAHVLGPNAPVCVVRCGPAECSGSAEAKGEGEGERGMGLLPHSMQGHVAHGHMHVHPHAHAQASAYGYGYATSRAYY